MGFEVLIRPVVRCGRGSDRAGKERDAFQSEAELHPKGEMRRTREDVYGTGYLLGSPSGARVWRKRDLGPSKECGSCASSAGTPQKGRTP